MRRRRLLALGTAAVGLAGYKRYIWPMRRRPEEDVSSIASDASDGAPFDAADQSSTGTANQEVVTDPPRIGGTLNGRPRRLRNDLHLIEKSNTTWIHGFLDVRKKLDGDVPPRKDPDVVALRRAAGEAGAKLLVGLRWDFRGIWKDKEPKHVPKPGSPREAALFEYATKLLKALDHPVEIIALGNEPIWETLDEDLTGGDDSMVGFTRRLKDHVVRNYANDDTQILLGAINRLYDDEIWSEYNGFYQQLFEMVREDDDIDGVDVHVHFSDIEEADRMFTIARQMAPEATITVTEFSPMWRYVELLDERIDSFHGGGKFVNRHGLPDAMTVRDFFRTAKQNPRPRPQMGDFMATMPWYNENLVVDMYDLMDKYDVDLGMLGFLLDEGARNVEWDDSWRPFQISYLFQRPLIATEDGGHPHYLADYRKRA